MTPQKLWGVTLLLSKIGKDMPHPAEGVFWHILPVLKNFCDVCSPQQTEKVWGRRSQIWS